MERHNPKPERNLVRTQHYKRGAPSNGQNLRKRLAIQTKTSTTNDSNDNDLTKSDGRINNPHQRRHQPAPYTRKKYRSSQNNQGNRRSDDEINPHHILRTTEGSPQDLKSYTINTNRLQQDKGKKPGTRQILKGPHRGDL